MSSYSGDKSSIRLTDKQWTLIYKAIEEATTEATLTEEERNELDHMKTAFETQLTFVE